MQTLMHTCITNAYPRKLRHAYTLYSTHTHSHLDANAHAHTDTLTDFLLLLAAYCTGYPLWQRLGAAGAHRTNQMREGTHSSQAMGGPLPPTPGAARQNGIHPRDYLKIISGRKD